MGGRSKRGIRSVAIGAGAMFAVMLTLGGVAQAAPGDHGNGVGGCTAGNFYGNTTNPRPGGNGVLPSQSPGPFVNTGPNEPPRNDRVRGASVGDVQQGAHDLLGPPAGNYTGRDVNGFLCTTP